MSARKKRFVLSVSSNVPLAFIYPEVTINHDDLMFVLYVSSSAAEV